MEARTRGEEGHLSAPGSFVVRMHADDFERLEPHRSYLEREWSELLREMGARVGIRYDTEPRVSMIAQEGVPRGAVEVGVAGDPEAPAAPGDSAGSRVRRYHLRLLKGVSAEDIYPLRPERRAWGAAPTATLRCAIRPSRASRIHRDGRRVARPSGPGLDERNIRERQAHRRNAPQRRRRAQTREYAAAPRSCRPVTFEAHMHVLSLEVVAALLLVAAVAARPRPRGLARSDA